MKSEVPVCERNRDCGSPNFTGIYIHTYIHRICAHFIQELGVYERTSRTLLLLML